MVQIIRQTPRSEQDLTDGTVDRIEYGRALKMRFVKGDGTTVDHTFNLQGGVATTIGAATMAALLIGF